MKILIVGGVAGGATTATRLRRLDENAEIIIFEKGNYISFANCGLPYYIGDVIKEKNKLLLQTPESFKKRFNIDVRINQEVTNIDRKNKKIEIQNLITKKIYEEYYDKLVLSPGAEPINPFRELKTDKIRTLRTIDDSIIIKKHIKTEKPKFVLIIGGGYIGIEMAENLRQYNDIEISIIEKTSHLINPLDEDMANFVHNELKKNSITVILNNGVKQIEKTKNQLQVTLDNGSLTVDYIILCIGITPDTKLAIQSGLKVNHKNSIIVSNYMQTSDANIYALGDAVQVANFVTKLPAHIPLAGPANKQARIVANNIIGKNTKYKRKYW